MDTSQNAAPEILAPIPFESLNVKGYTERCEFSVVMSVYENDIAEFFHEAVHSVLAQSVPPNELVIVIDGPIGTDLMQAVESLRAQVIPLTVVPLPKNQGLARARHIGILSAKFDIIAVMDSDDICVEDRFKWQLAALTTGEKCNVVGGWIEEFDSVKGDSGRRRIVPATHEEIYAFGKWRSPMNHVTIMFRRSSYLEVGGYKDIYRFEDVDLFGRMLVRGIRFKNVPEVLVHVRCGDAMFRRRGGWKQLRSETGVVFSMYRSGYISAFHLIAIVALRAMVKLSPSGLRRWVYLRLLRKSPTREG